MYDKELKFNKLKIVKKDGEFNKLEKKLGIQEKVIQELKEKSKEPIKDASKQEVEKLIKEVAFLQSNIREKKTLLDEIRKEN